MFIIQRNHHLDSVIICIYL